MNVAGFLLLALAFGPPFAAAAAGPASQAPPPQAPVPEAPGDPAQAPVVWFQGSFEAVGAKARAEQRAVCVFLASDASRWSRRLEREAWSDPRVAAAVEGVLVWKADGARGAGVRLAERVGATDLPVTLCFDATGNAVDRIDGFLAAEPFAAELLRVKSGEGTAPDLARRVAAAPDDVELRARYAEKLRSLGDHAGEEREVQELTRRDRSRTSLPLRRRLYAERLARIEEHYQDTREINPGPLVRFLETERHAELLFQGHLALAALHQRRADDLETAQQLVVARAKRGDLRATLARAARHLPANPAIQVEFAIDTVLVYARAADELGDADRALILQLAASAVGLAPDDARAHAAAATAAFLDGDKLSAAAALRRALELEPDHPEWLPLAHELGL